MKSTILFCALSFLPFISMAQGEAYNAFGIAQESAKENPEDYLAPIRALKAISYDSTDRMAQDVMAQAYMTYYSFAGDYEKTLEASISRFGPRRNAKYLQVRYDSTFVKSHRFVDAKTFILQKAGEHQVIMINEAHHIPYHRSFVTEILQGLYDKGFRYLALETLSSARLNERGYPDYNSGFYSREPLFSEMLRQAIKVGFTLIPYENEKECDNKGSGRFYCNTFRDSMQAVNLQQRIFQNQNDAKVLVFAGYAHIEKGSNNGWRKMAEIFRELTGIEPYCIDQTDLRESFNIAYEGKIYQSVMGIENPQQPVVAVKENQAFANNSMVDASIIHPRSRKVNDRPGFYTIDGKRKAYELTGFFPATGQLVQAFYAEEQGDRVPADQYIVKTQNESLFLFPGKYDIIVRSVEGPIVHQEKIVQK